MKKDFQVGEASSSSQEHPSGQETTIATSAAGCTVLIRHTKMGDESTRTEKMDDEWGQEEEIDVEEQGKVTVRQESGSIDDDDDESGDEPSMVEFEDPVYELSQTYDMEPEYENMTLE